MSQPWFPFYVGDYVRDTARLTTEAHGAYLLLILDYWANGAPPDSDETLATITKLSRKEWAAMRSRLAPFFVLDGGKWTHKRIERERALADEKHRRRVEAGKQGGDAKAKAQANAKQSPSNASLDNETLPYQPQSQPQSSRKEHSRSIEADRPVRAPSRFDEFLKAYPRRDGPNPRAPAEKKFDALVKSGVEPQFLIDAVMKFAAEEAGRGNTGTRFIPQAVTWLNQQRWSDHAAVAFLAGEPLMSPEQVLEQALAMYARNGHWSRHAPGAPPGEPGCIATPEQLAAVGLDQHGRKLQPPEAA